MRPRITYVSPVDHKALIKALRDDGVREYGLHGDAEIGAWFARVGFCYPLPSPSRLKGWEKEYGLPVAYVSLPKVRRLTKWTTNVLLMTWTMDQYRARRLPRWHPFRVKVAVEAHSKFALNAQVRSRGPR